jgi:hypothetical protein
MASVALAIERERHGVSNGGDHDSKGPLRSAPEPRGDLPQHVRETSARLLFRLLVKAPDFLCRSDFERKAPVRPKGAW